MRSPRRLLLVALAAVAAAGCGVPLKRGTAARPAIVSFDLQGTDALSAGDVQDRLVTQASDRLLWPPWHLFGRETRYLDDDAFENDKRRILRYYQSKGYYGARIVSSEVVPVAPGFVDVKVRVDEGKPTRVTRLAIDGMEDAPDARARLGKLPLREGDVFTEQAYDATRAAILDALTATGWAEAEVAQSAQVDPAVAEAHVRYDVTPGERYRFGNVFVAGAAAIPRARIRDRAEQAIKPGDVFDATDLPKAQARVYDLGVFGGVRVTEGTPDEAKKAIPVVVTVREAPFRTVRAGPGVTVQNTRYQADVIAGWMHRNWLGGLRKLSLDARAGYAWLPTVFNASKEGFVGLASADFTQPGVIRDRIDFNLRAELERGLEQAYDFFAERVRFGFPLRYGRLVSFTPSVNLELYQLRGQVQQAAVSGGATSNVLTLRTCPGHDPNLCLLSYFEQRLAIDLRDDVIETHRGFYFSLSVQEGFSAFGAGSSYLRLLPEARAFASLPGSVVLAGRVRVGLVEPFRGSNDVPIVAKFTSGGPNFMRGYYTRDLSPVLFVKNDPKCVDDPGRALCPGGYVPVGGNGLVDGSLELRFPLGQKLLGVTFLDFGDVRLSAAESLDLRNLQYAAGVGIRYLTLFGPIRVDVAARLPTAPGGWPAVQQVQLTEEGAVKLLTVHHAPIVSVHLSVGEAF